MKHKKILIGSIVAILAISMWATMPIETRGMTIMLDIPDDAEDLVRNSELIIIGTYVNQRTEYTNDDDFPLRSVTTVNVDEVLKGTYTNPTIEIYDFGSGTSFKTGYRVEIDSGINLEYKTNEQMFMFLDYDEGNVLGDGYFLLANQFGKYTINGTDANYIIEDRSTTVKDIRDKIQPALM